MTIPAVTINQAALMLGIDNAAAHKLLRSGALELAYITRISEGLSTIHITWRSLHKELSARGKELVPRNLAECLFVTKDTHNGEASSSGEWFSAQCLPCGWESHFLETQMDAEAAWDEHLQLHP